jgi:hypothetical protein
MKKSQLLKIVHFGLCLSLFLLIPGELLASDKSRLSDIAPPFKGDDELPPRTPPIIEIGDAFLGTGNLAPGFTLPTGAVWQPRFWVYGQYRSALQAWDTGEDSPRQAEWANRLDIFGNLQLTGTERIVIGIQPLQGQSGQHTGYRFTPDENGFENFNANIRTLFFEGDFAELFPNLDVFDFSPNDLGFSIGRQNILFQDGFVINDTVDAVGITRNNLRFTSLPWLSNARITALYAWNGVHRDDNRRDKNADLFALFTQWDTIYSTIDADITYVSTDNASDDDLFSGGISAVQRFGGIATTFRVLGSWAPNSRSRQADNGVLFFTEVAWTPPYGYNIAYINAFAGIDNFRSAARDVNTGGPLGRTGILFAARGIGSFPAALSNSSDQAYGAALGYQMFFDNARRQVIVEIGGRADNSNTFSGAGIAARFQQAIGRRYIIQFDGFGTAQENSNFGYGIRSEFIVKF